MKRFTDAGRQAIACGNLYAGLSLALTLPDICAALEHPTRKSRRRYVQWCEKWLVPKFPMSGVTNKRFISAEECFQMRCSLLHAGESSVNIKKRQIIHEFIFFDTTVESHMNLGHDLVPHKGKHVPNFIQLRADYFGADIFAAVDEWDASVQSDEVIQKRKAGLLTIRSRGYEIGGLGTVG